MIRLFWWVTVVLWQRRIRNPFVALRCAWLIYKFQQQWERR